jgi:hypothetical protein
MPHDKHGQVLTVGDRVTVLATVKSVTTTEEYCNVGLETVEPMYPGETRSSLTLNAKQVERVQAYTGR